MLEEMNFSGTGGGGDIVVEVIVVIVLELPLRQSDLKKRKELTEGLLVSRSRSRKIKRRSFGGRVIVALSEIAGRSHCCC